MVDVARVLQVPGLWMHVDVRAGVLEAMWPKGDMWVKDRWLRCPCTASRGPAGV